MIQAIMKPKDGIAKLLDLYKTYFGCLNFSKMEKDDLIRIYRNEKKKLTAYTKHVQTHT